ncbi:MAG TPA: hypothetical protein VKO43_08600 [Candidatus Krumholzibacteriaceae bacterium]|nr:hypothetical protein [Candidatus Krumholzibacteriaceae bacterium]
MKSGRITTDPDAVANLEADIPAEPEIELNSRHSWDNPRENIGINCPSCGGSLSIPEGIRSILCEYCGSDLYILNPRGVRSFYIEPGITAGKARLRALNLLNQRTGGRIGARHTSVVDLKLIHVPFWRMKGRFIGWICGDEFKTRTVEKYTDTPGGEMSRKVIQQERKPFSKFISRNINWSAPACVMRHLGLQGISFRSRFGDWKVFDHSLKRSMNIALVTVPRGKAEANGFRYTASLSRPAGCRIDASRFHLFDKRLSVYYYPVYLLFYKYRGIIYEVTIDGNDGHIIRSDVPEIRSINPAYYFFIPAAAAFLAGTCFPLIFAVICLLYISDMIRNTGIINPLKWMKYKLNKWFGKG